MAKTLFDLTYQLSRLLEQTVSGTATGGSTTTLIDTVERTSLTETDDQWNGGTIWINRDAGGAGAAPEGEYGYISDYVASTSTLTIRTALTAAIASGDGYSIAKKRYPLSLLKQKINEALGGVIEKTDITTITIADEQTEYSLPSEVLDLKQVYISTNAADTNDNRWEQLFDWDVQKSATGTANKIVFSRQHTAGEIIKLVYLGYHSVLQNPTDKLDDSIHQNLILYRARLGCLEWYKERLQDNTLDGAIQQAIGELNQVNVEFAQKFPKKSAKTIHLVFGRP